MKIIASFFIVLGNFLIVSPHLSKYSSFEIFINIFILIFIPWTSNSLYVFASFLIIYTLIDNLCEDLSNMPKSHIEKWAWKKIKLLRKFQSFMNAPTFIMILVGYITSIIHTYIIYCLFF